MTDKKKLNKEEIKRYSRHIILPEVGLSGQKKLKQKSVLLVGAGGLGAPLAMYLSAAGLGKIGMIDSDVVDHSNLHRQVIYNTQDVGRPKLDAARDGIKNINPNVEVETFGARLTNDNAFNICKPYDIIIDGTDNYPARYLVNDTCVLLNKPNIYGSIFRFYGQTSVFDVSKGPCYRCLYPDPPPNGLVPNCAEGGVLGVLPGIVGLIQATETIKLIIGKGDLLIGRLLLFDALKMKFREVKFRKDPDCPICGKNKTITSLIDYEEFCSYESPHIKKEAERTYEISPKDLKTILDKKKSIILLDVRQPHEYDINHIPGAKLIPLNNFEDRINELDRNQEIIIYCRSGARSYQAANILRDANFQRVKNLIGGIIAWSFEVGSEVNE